MTSQSGLEPLSNSRLRDMEARHLSMRDLLDAATEKIAAVLDLHTALDSIWAGQFCGECAGTWPCPTVRALTEPEEAA